MAPGPPGGVTTKSVSSGRLTPPLKLTLNQHVAHPKRAHGLGGNAITLLALIIARCELRGFANRRVHFAFVQPRHHQKAHASQQRRDADKRMNDETDANKNDGPRRIERGRRHRARQHLPQGVEIARGLGKKDLILIKALQLAASAGREQGTNQWDGSYVQTTRNAAKAAYLEAGIRNPRKELSAMEVHDCFSITELVTMEDLGVSESGQAWKDVMNGVFDADGELPCQIDGGLKCFGHPIGASGLRMVYEHYLQLQGRAGPRQLKSPSIGLSHNLGGVPYNGVCAISIVGLESRT